MEKKTGIISRAIIKGFEPDPCHAVEAFQYENLIRRIPRLQEWIQGYHKFKTILVD